MRKFSPVLMLAAAFPLAGCWQSEVSLYGGRTPLEPFPAGKVEGRNVKDKTAEHSVLSKEAGGVYRLANDVKGSSDFGDSFALRFFALADAPPKVFVFEAQERKVCKPADNMCTPDTHFYYGLARAEADGASVENPDCPKGSAVAKLSGVTPDDYGICNFSDRAALDKALAMQAKKPWKPQVVYRFTASPK